MLVIEGAFKHKDFFAAPMFMRVELGIGCPFHERDIFTFILVKRHDVQAVNQTRMPWLGSCIDGKLALILRGKLVQLYKDRRAIIANHDNLAVQACRFLDSLDLVACAVWRDLRIAHGLNPFELFADTFKRLFCRCDLKLDTS